MKVKNTFTKVTLILLLIGLVMAVSYRELIAYGFMQLQGQLKVVREAVSLDEFMQMDSTTQEQKEKIQVIIEAKKFAFEELGINYSDNYSTIFDQKGVASMYVVTACEPYAFVPRLWSFPIIGEFPYKGFFEKGKAIEEFKRVRDEEHQDAGLRTAGGWSTLGWFKDPVLSNMLNREEGDLASLIIHELTHGTIFVKDSVTFNENLANFIGDNGAILFMEKKYGKASPEVNDFINKMSDEIVFKEYMLSSAQYLNELYQGFTTETDSLKELRKMSRITEIKKNYDTLSFKSTRYRDYFEKYTPNNTFFMSMLRYNGQQEELQRQLDLDFNGDLKSYILYLKKNYPSL